MAEKESRGLFLVLEGIDGSGKSVQARLLVRRLEKQELDVLLTQEPTDGPWGRRYRSWARGDSEASAEEVAHFFIEDRREHVEGVIRPALERGCVVVCDRYSPSTLAYQAAQGLDRAELAARHREFPVPDLVIWLRVPVALALERLGERVEERFEKREFLERVDSEYAKLGLSAVDGTGTEEQVAARVRALVPPLLRAPPGESSR